RELVDGGLGVLGRLGGQRHSDEDDLLPDRPLDQRHGASSPSRSVPRSPTVVDPGTTARSTAVSMRATNVAGPVSAATRSPLPSVGERRVTSTAPPGIMTRAASPTIPQCRA